MNKEKIALYHLVDDEGSHWRITVQACGRLITVLTIFTSEEEALVVLLWLEKNGLAVPLKITKTTCQLSAPSLEEASLFD